MDLQATWDVRAGEESCTEGSVREPGPGSHAEIGPERPWRGAGSPREWWAHRDVEGTGGQAESTVQRVWQRVAQDSWVDRPLRRGVGQEARKDPEPAVTGIQSARAPSHDPLGSLLGTQEAFHFCPWPSTCPWSPPAATPNPRARLYPPHLRTLSGRQRVASPQDTGRGSQSPCVLEVLRGKPVLETCTEGHLLLPSPAAAQNAGREKGCERIAGQW